MYSCIFHRNCRWNGREDAVGLRNVAVAVAETRYGAQQKILKLSDNDIVPS